MLSSTAPPWGRAQALRQATQDGSESLCRRGLKRPLPPAFMPKTLMRLCPIATGAPWLARRCTARAKARISRHRLIQPFRRFASSLLEANRLYLCGFALTFRSPLSSILVRTHLSSTRQSRSGMGASTLCSAVRNRRSLSTHSLNSSAADEGSCRSGPSAKGYLVVHSCAMLA